MANLVKCSHSGWNKIFKKFLKIFQEVSGISELVIWKMKSYVWHMFLFLVLF